MAEKREEAGFEDIALLIGRDKEQALKRFRQGRFDQNVRRKIAAGRREGDCLFGRRAAALAAGAALLILAAGAALLVSRRSGPVLQEGPGPMAGVLGGLPGISDVLMPKETNPPGEWPAFGSARAALMSAAEQKAAEERKAAAVSGPADVPRLSLEKKMEILFKDRVIERVLGSISKRSEEV